MAILKRYLGDGVYADFDEIQMQLILTTEDGVRETNRIVFNKQVLEEMHEYLGELGRYLNRVSGVSSQGG